MRLIYIVLASFFIISCASTNYEIGSNFTAEQVEGIEKGVTTQLDIIAVFGEPASKTRTSEGSEVWMYQYINTSSHAQNLVVTMNVETRSESKSLMITFIDDVVEKYTFTESPSTVKSY